jgi:ATP-dependent exoDNAse (exonuclease V) beta subunit
VPPDLLAALETDEINAARERERLLYVAFTRARDLLVLSKLPSQGPKSWTDIVDDPCQDLPELDLGVLPLRPVMRPVQRPNEQTAEVFSGQQQTIAANLRSIAWLRPSLDDLDRMPATELLVTEAEAGIETPLTVGAGRLRGLLLHKLMEEVLTAELADELPALRTRAQELLLQLSSRHNVQKPMPIPDELAATIRKTLEIPDIAQIRYGLVPELSIFGILPDMSHARVSGRADAIFIEANEPRAVIDWKSDIAPSQADVDLHAAQLNTYMRAAKIDRGALVYLSTATVQWLTL